MTVWEAANTLSYLQNPNNIDDDAHNRSCDADIDNNQNDEFDSDHVGNNESVSQMKRRIDGQGGVNIKVRKKEKRLETAEAALARLTHAYKTALNCMGALHHVSAAIVRAHIENELNCKEKGQHKKLTLTETNLQKQKDDSLSVSTGNQGSKGKTLQRDKNKEDEDNFKRVLNDLFEQLVNAAQSARYAFEETILLDPLVSSYAPSFCYAHNAMISKLQRKSTLEKVGIHKVTDEKVVSGEKSLNDDDIAASNDRLIGESHQSETKEVEDEKDDNDHDEELMLIQRITLMKKKMTGSTVSNITSDMKSFSNANNLIISSSAHRSSIQELAYLSLINYADLLTCCTYVKNDKKQNMLQNESATILEQGIIKTLPGLSIVLQSRYRLENEYHSLPNQDESFSCWNRNSNVHKVLKDTRKLALTAYFDASQINLRFDPSLWNKLACSARSFEKATISANQQKNMEQQQHFSHRDADDIISETSNITLRGNVSSILSPHVRWLERYALERGLTTTLPNGIPPNRILLKSLAELHNEKQSFAKRKYDSIHNLPFTKNSMINKNQKRQNLTLNLTRYSWSTLGRLLMKVCKEDNGHIFPKSHGANYENTVIDCDNFYQLVRKRVSDVVAFTAQSVFITHIRFLAFKFDHMTFFYN